MASTQVLRTPLRLAGRRSLHNVSSSAASSVSSAGSPIINTKKAAASAAQLLLLRNSNNNNNAVAAALNKQVHISAAASSAAAAASPSASAANGDASSSSSSHIVGRADAFRGQQQISEAGWEANIRGLPGLEGPRGDDWWTGRKPVYGECPGVDANNKISSLPYVNMATATRQQLRDYFDNTWAITETLFASLQTEEAFYRPPYHHLRHPKIFYYAHPATVYVNKFRVAGLISGPINEYFEHIFETGVDEMKWDDMSKNNMVWPSVSEITAYRKQVYNMIVDVIENHPAFETRAQLENSPFWAVLLGTEHERIHIETSSVLIRELPSRLVRRPENMAEYHASTKRSGALTPTRGVDFPENEFVGVASTRVQLGKPRSFPTFGWDNEYGQKAMQVKSFRVSKYKVSNGEFHEFVKSGGYAEKKFWTAEGWQWRSFRNVRHPTYWVPTGPAGLHQYKLRNTFDLADMQWDWPAVVNYHEAKAYATWKSQKDGQAAGREYRLLTEAEHKAICDDSIFQESLGVARDPVMMLGGQQMLQQVANLNLGCMSESPVNALPPTSAGVHDAAGNVWEWCEDHFNALPGFKIHPYYEDFSLPCFDGQHNVIMGGSFISTGDEASIFARFHFRPHFHQHSGFRLVEPNQEDPALVTSCMDNAGPFVGVNPFRRSKEADNTVARYSEKQTLGQFLHLHFGKAKLGLSSGGADIDNYPERVGAWIQSLTQRFNVKTSRALDLGCGPGGITFQLSNIFDKTIGIDLSAAFIEAASKIQAEGELPYSVLADGVLAEDFVAERPRKARPNNVQFKQMDALCLSPSLGAFDLVFLGNLIDRLPSPNGCLSRMGGERGMVRPGGLLVITSPFSWDRQFTPQELWLGGYTDAEGRPVSSMDGLKDTLGPSFELVDTTTLPLVIRDHARKYQLLFSQGSVWRKKV